MWRVSQADLSQLRGAGGQRFMHFVDRLIRAEAARRAVPQSAIRTQLRANIQDGGVDTEVKEAITGSPSGWFPTATCWQYKAKEGIDVNDSVKGNKPNELQEEIQKPYARRLIENGYAFRLCVLGDLTPEKTQNWEAQLDVEAKSINSNAPPVRVVSGGDLAAWAEQFPSVVAWLRHVSPGVLNWEAWGQNACDVLGTYVPNPEWQDVRKQILAHAEFSCVPAAGNPCLSIGGAAGVGKTRLVFESLAELLAAPGLVLYSADDREARVVATSVANTPDQCVVLVADECGAEVRHLLDDTLRGHSNRIRVVCIDNRPERLASSRAQIWLGKVTAQAADNILAANYPAVPPDRRLNYASLSGGFIRLAADMAEHDAELARGDLDNVLGTVEQYVRRRLKAPQLELLSAVALFHRLGHRDDVADELGSLSARTGRRPQEFRDAVREVRESPGFVVLAGRYWYVTPDIVARVLFAEGWNRWVDHDVEGFFKAITPHRVQDVIERAGKFGGAPQREKLASFFRHWFAALMPEHLADAQTTALAVAVVETAPEDYLQRLRALIERSSGDELGRILGDAYNAPWGPRRLLVWLFERLGSFPNYFLDCEAGLFRLALYETEPRIGSNATSMWSNLFSVYLSGTAAPFQVRLDRLAERAASGDRGEATLAFRGVARVFARPGGKPLPPPLVAGRLRPRDWEPANPGEELDCYRSTLALCEGHIRNDRDWRHALAFGAIADNAYLLLMRGLLPELRRVASPDYLTEKELRGVIHTVNDFLEAEGLRERGDAEPGLSYLNEVKCWADGLRPSDFGGRLRTAFSRDPWDPAFTADKAKGEDAGKLAEEIVAQPALLSALLDWLGSPEARAAERLGFALGSLDGEFRCAPAIFEHASQTAAAPLVRGYVRGLVHSGRRLSAEVVRLSQDLEAAQPVVAMDVLSYGGDPFDGFNRGIALVERGAVAAQYLILFAGGVGARPMTADELARAMDCLSRAAGGGDEQAGLAGVRLVATYLYRDPKTGSQTLESEAARQAVWGLLEAVPPDLTRSAAYDWAAVVEGLAALEPDRAAVLLGRTLVSDDVRLARQAERTLKDLAPRAGAQVMAALGRSLLDPDEGWRLEIHSVGELVSAIPEESVLAWVRAGGMGRARAIARHLPAPHLGEAQNPVVPRLTDLVLTEYDDEEVFRDFCVGVHAVEGFFGNASEHFRRQAREAQRFLDHPNRRIREWAQREITQRLTLADREELEEQEDTW